MKKPVYAVGQFLVNIEFPYTDEFQQDAVKTIPTIIRYCYPVDSTKQLANVTFWAYLQDQIDPNKFIEMDRKALRYYTPWLAAHMTRAWQSAALSIKLRYDPMHTYDHSNRARSRGIRPLDYDMPHYHAQTFGRIHRPGMSPQRYHETVNAPVKDPFE